MNGMASSMSVLVQMSFGTCVSNLVQSVSAAVQRQCWCATTTLGCVLGSACVHWQSLMHRWTVLAGPYAAK
jgi:hypothetical protein